MIWCAILQLSGAGMTRRRSGWRTVVARVVALHMFWRNASAEVVPCHICNPPEGGEGRYVDELCKVSTIEVLARGKDIKHTTALNDKFSAKSLTILANVFALT
jgi:hypothetical protein